MKKLTKKQHKVLENNGWKVSDYFDDGRVEIQKMSPAGEDFSACFEVETFQKDVEDYAASFDINEHVSMWLQAAREGVGGVPDAEALVEDAKAIKEMLGDLAEALRFVYKADIEVTGKEMQEIISLLTKTRTEQLSGSGSYGLVLNGMFDNGVVITVEAAVGSDGDEKGHLSLTLIHNGSRIVGDMPGDWYDPETGSYTDWADALSHTIYLGDDINKNLSGEYRYRLVIKDEESDKTEADAATNAYLAYAKISTAYVDPKTGEQNMLTKWREVAGIVMAKTPDAAIERIYAELPALHKKFLGLLPGRTTHIAMAVDEARVELLESQWAGQNGIAPGYGVSFVLV